MTLYTTMLAYISDPASIYMNFSYFQGSNSTAVQSY